MILLLKWGLVAGMTFAIDLIAFYALANAMKQIVIANVFAFIISTAFNFLLHNNWTFGKPPSRDNSLFRYLAFLILNLILTSFTLSFFIEITESLVQGKGFNSLFWLPINFLVMKMFTFNNKNE